MEGNINQESGLATRQNLPEQICLLAASSSVYSKAKRILGVQFTLTIMGAVVWSILVESKPNLKVWLVFYAFAVALLDALYLEKQQTRLKVKGRVVGGIRVLGEDSSRGCGSRSLE
ncbi:MAG: hypothetical protein KF749_09930 [Bacteroidetes bacterium]|nr:hypothetical protein [Bacteroidota bacterium]MCW5896715.1 hypothetical protein [Bacteroidota bacterium]